MVEAFDMGPAMKPSALIRTARWSLLLVGIWWGHKRFTHHKAIADERRAYEAKMKPIWDAEERARKEKANREQLLVLAKEAGVKVPANF